MEGKPLVASNGGKLVQFPPFSLLSFAVPYLSVYLSYWLLLDACRLNLEAEELVMQTLELDCAPGYPRPGDLITGVLEGTGLAVPEKPVSMFFGNWTYAFDVPAEEWKTRIQPIIKPRIEALYRAGKIRYGSW